jgi:predicted phosphodiesterase
MQHGSSTARSLFIKNEIVPKIHSGKINKSQAARIVAEKFGIDKESARASVRQQTGAIGKTSVQSMPEFKMTIQQGLSAIKKQMFPEKKNIQLTDCRALILSDIHIPHHNVEAVELALNYGVEQECDTIILNGDIMDFYQVSKWDREPSMMGIEQELVGVQQLFGLLRKLFPNAPIIYREGNHEERLRAYLISKAKELSNLEELRLESLMNAKGYNINVLSKPDTLRLGKLNVLHGHEFGESIFSPVNPARGLFLKAKASTIVGHHHQVSYHSEGTINGDKIGCWSLGCLCDLDPLYRPFAHTKWNHGFAVVEVDSDGSFHVHNKQIVNGRIV